MKFHPTAQIALAMAALGLIAWNGREGGRGHGPRTCDPERMVERTVAAYQEGESCDRRGGRRRGPDPQKAARIYDANEDGTLDQAEQAEMLADFTVRCENVRAKMLEKHDANGDGELDKAEAEAARQGAREKHRGRRASKVAEHDSDGDGELSPEERQTARADRQTRRGERRAERIAEFDSDGDGVLDEQERAVQRDAMRERIRSGQRGRPF